MKQVARVCRACDQGQGLEAKRWTEARYCWVSLINKEFRFSTKNKGKQLEDVKQQDDVCFKKIIVAEVQRMNRGSGVGQTAEGQRRDKGWVLLQVGKEGHLDLCHSIVWR